MFIDYGWVHKTTLAWSRLSGQIQKKDRTARKKKENA